jgi:hypothetical protein
MRFHRDPRPSVTSGPITAKGPISQPSPITAPGSMMAEGWMRGRVNGHAPAFGTSIIAVKVGLGRQFALDHGAAFELPDPPPPRRP